MVFNSLPLSADEWKEADSFSPIPYEKVVGLNNLLSIAWLGQGLTLAGAVARVLLPNETGTGFLIGPDMLLTNNHVFPSADDAAKATIEFNYQDNWAGVLQPVRRFPTDSSYFRTNADLDYSIVRVPGAPGDLYGFVDLTVRADPLVNDYVSIIQHPAGGPKQVSLTDNKVSAVFDDKVQYATDTEAGSSGSPVFNQSWQLVGLHHAGGGLTGPDGAKYFTNEGIVISAIIADAAQFLGLTDPLYDQAFGDLRSLLINLIDVADPQPRPADLLPDLLWTRPSFATALDQWSKMNAVSGQATAVAVGAAGVAVGAALRQWARSAGHESISAAAASTPPPSDGLRSVVSQFNGSASVPSDVYAAVLNAVKGAPDLVAPLVAAVGTLDTASPLNMTVIASTFLTGVVMGGEAFGPVAQPEPSAVEGAASAASSAPASAPASDPRVLRRSQ
jgi:V8-like Glu-specific endopeptidase